MEAGFSWFEAGKLVVINCCVVTSTCCVSQLNPPQVPSPPPAPQVLGLAIYNGVLLDFPLPLALYRKILGQEVKLRDLEDMQPTLGRCGVGLGGNGVVVV